MSIITHEQIVKLVLAWKDADAAERARIEQQLARHGFTLIQAGDKVFLKEIAHVDGTRNGAAAT